MGFVIGGNIYDSLYPPLFSGPVIDVEQVLKRIDKSGLEPTEARYYRVIEKDRQGNVEEISVSVDIEWHVCLKCKRRGKWARQSYVEKQ